MTSAPRWLLVIAALIAALSSTSRAAKYSQGDEITLTRDEPLLFREQVFRRGKAGEKFTVLAHRADTKKVIVSATDKTGKQIALSVPEEAVARVPVDVEKLRTSAVAAARLGKFPDALRLIDQAVRTAPSDAALSQTKNAIMQLQDVSTSLIQAQTEKVRIATEAAQKRKNAEVIERANLQSPRYASNFDRAQPAQLRLQADVLEEKLKQKRQTAAVLLMDVESAKVRLRAAAEIPLTRKPASLSLANGRAGQPGLVQPSDVQRSSNNGPMPPAPQPQITVAEIPDSKPPIANSDASPIMPNPAVVYAQPSYSKAEGLGKNAETPEGRGMPQDDAKAATWRQSQAREASVSQHDNKVDSGGDYRKVAGAALLLWAQQNSSPLGAGNQKPAGPGGNRLQSYDFKTGRFQSNSIQPSNSTGFLHWLNQLLSASPPPGTTIFGQGYYRP